MPCAVLNGIRPGRRGRGSRPGGGLWLVCAQGRWTRWFQQATPSTQAGLLRPCRLDRGISLQSVHPCTPIAPLRPPAVF